MKFFQPVGFAFVWLLLLLSLSACKRDYDARVQGQDLPKFFAGLYELRVEDSARKYPLARRFHRWRDLDSGAELELEGWGLKGDRLYVRSHFHRLKKGQKLVYKKDLGEKLEEPMRSVRGCRAAPRSLSGKPNDKVIDRVHYFSCFVSSNDPSYRVFEGKNSFRHRGGEFVVKVKAKAGVIEFNEFLESRNLFIVHMRQRFPSVTVGFDKPPATGAELKVIMQETEKLGFVKATYRSPTL